MGWGTAIGAGLTLAGGLAGQEAGRGDRERANQLMEEALSAFRGIDIPDIQKQQLYFEHLQSQGKLTPEMVAAVEQGPSAFESIQTDPKLAQAQMNALQQMQKMGEQGLTAGDLAALAQGLRQAAGQNQAQQAQILQNMEARGVGGSGAELAARLQASQGSADMANQQALAALGQAQNRMLQGVAQSGQMAGTMRGQGFAEQSAKAQASDFIKNWNAQQQQGTNYANVAARNQAQGQNLANQQRIADTNVGLSNQQQQHNKGLLQQDFMNRMAKATGLAGVVTSPTGAAKQYGASGGSKAQGAADVGAGLGQIVSAFV